MNVHTGDTIPEWEMPSVSPERMRTMAAILRDPNPVHWDPTVCAQLGFGNHVINQGPLGLSYIINMLHAWSGIDSLRRITMTFPQVVLDEDRVVARGRVTAVRQAGTETLAECEVWLQLEASKDDEGWRNRSRGGRLLEGTAVVTLSRDDDSG